MVELLSRPDDDFETARLRFACLEGELSDRNPASSAIDATLELSDSILRCDRRRACCAAATAAGESTTDGNLPGAIRSVSLARLLESRESECVKFLVLFVDTANSSGCSSDFVA